jgi:hypothetical protein
MLRLDHHFFLHQLGQAVIANQLQNNQQPTQLIASSTASASAKPRKAATSAPMAAEGSSPPPSQGKSVVAHLQDWGCK